MENNATTGIIHVLSGRPSNRFCRLQTTVIPYYLNSRIFYFYNDGAEQIYTGSADLMPRNINRRVEVLFPVQEQRLIRYLRDEVLEIYLKANLKTRKLLPDGSYNWVKSDQGDKPLNPQTWLIERRTKAKPE